MKIYQKYMFTPSSFILLMETNSEEFTHLLINIEIEMPNAPLFRIPLGQGLNFSKYPEFFLPLISYFILFSLYYYYYYLVALNRLLLSQFACPWTQDWIWKLIRQPVGTKILKGDVKLIVTQTGEQTETGKRNLKTIIRLRP